MRTDLSDKDRKRFICEGLKKMPEGYRAEICGSCKGTGNGNWCAWCDGQGLMVFGRNELDDVIMAPASDSVLNQVLTAGGWVPSDWDIGMAQRITRPRYAPPLVSRRLMRFKHKGHCVA